MSLVPALETGVSNAGIFMLCDTLSIPVLLLIAKKEAQ